MMNKSKYIFELIDKGRIEEAVCLGMEYFQLSFSEDGMELVVPKQSPILDMDIPSRLSFYSFAGLYYLYAGFMACASAFLKEIWQGTKSLPMQWVTKLLQ